MSLMSKAIDENAISAINNSLYRAIYSGDTTTVNAIIDTYGLSYSPKWTEGHDLLLKAVEFKHVETVKLLIRKGCSIENQVGECGTPEILRLGLCLAVNQGDCELITMILDSFQNPVLRINLIDSLNLLHLAVGEEKVEVVKLLLECGAHVECKSNGEVTPLHVAAVKGNCKIIELLLKAGSNIESEDRNQNTSLALAVSIGNKSVVKLLLKHGANCSRKNKSGTTPLIDATSKGYLEVVEDLLTYDADVDDANSLGLTALHIACLLKNKPLISLLLNAGADINATDCFGSVPCDTIFKTVLTGTYYFENPSLCYFLGKHLVILKKGGFYINKKNEILYNRFANMYCNDIMVNDSVLAPSSSIMGCTVKNCEKEILRMKNLKSNCGFTVHDIFKKMKDPLSLNICENEIKFLQSIDIKEQLPLFGSIMMNILKKAKKRNELIASGQECLWFIIHSSGCNVPFLPEEMRIHIMSFLTNEDIRQIIKCGEEIQKFRLILNTETIGS